MTTASAYREVAIDELQLHALLRVVGRHLQLDAQPVLPAPQAHLQHALLVVHAQLSLALAQRRHLLHLLPAGDEHVAVDELVHHLVDGLHLRLAAQLGRLVHALFLLVAKQRHGQRWAAELHQRGLHGVVRDVVHPQLHPGVGRPYDENGDVVSGQCENSRWGQAGLHELEVLQDGGVHSLHGLWGRCQ